MGDCKIAQHGQHLLLCHSFPLPTDAKSALPQTLFAPDSATLDHFSVFSRRLLDSSFLSSRAWKETIHTGVHHS